MKSLGEQALKKIENLIAKKEASTSTPNKKEKPISTFRPSRILEEGEEEKKENKPLDEKIISTSPARKSSHVYVPREREIKFIERQTKIIYDELAQKTSYKLQNPHSFFLNQKNPKLPIYQRAAQIAEDREAALEEKRRERLRIKE